MGRPRTSGRGGAFEIPDGHDATRMIRTTYGDDAGATTSVRLLVREGTASSLRRRATSVDAGGDEPGAAVEQGWDLVDLEVRSLPAIVQEICAAGPDVRVVRPPELREAVVDALTAVAAAHSGGEG